MLIGNIGGSLGEISAILLIIGGIIHVLQESHYMAYSGFSNWYGCVNCSNFLDGGPAELYQSGLPYFKWWINAWCYLYGNRYGFVANDTIKDNLFMVLELELSPFVSVCLVHILKEFPLLF